MNIYGIEEKSPYCPTSRCQTEITGVKDIGRPQKLSNKNLKN